MTFIVPGARCVKSYAIEDSAFYLIHIFQLHLATNVTPEQLRSIDDCQQDIYSICHHLQQALDVHRLFVEGFQRPLDSEDAQYMLERSRDLNDELGGFFTIGAAVILAAQDHFQVLPASNLSTDRKVRQDLQNLSLRHERRVQTLELIAKQQEKNDPYAVLIFGGQNRFGSINSCGPEYQTNAFSRDFDALGEYNTRNPNRKISLIEIIPQNYRTF